MAGTPLDGDDGDPRGRRRIPSPLGTRRWRPLAVAAVGALLLTAHGAAGAVCGNQVLEAGEQCELGPNGDAACQEACIPPGHSGECTCAHPSSSPASYAIIANESVRLCEASDVRTGHVGVLVGGGALTMGKGSRIAAGNHGVADRVLLQDRASVGRLFDNSDLFKGSVTVGDGPYRFHVPLALAPQLPPADMAVPGSIPVLAEEGSTQVLPPGAYASVIVARGATLLLRGTDPGRGVGTYNLLSLTIQPESRVVAENPVDVRIAGLLAIATRATLGPSGGAHVLAGDVRLTIAGLIVRIGHSAAIRAHLRAAGSLRVGRSASMIGRIIASKIKLGGGARLDVEGGCGDGVLDAAEECDNTAPGGTAACIATPCASPGQPGQCTCHCNSAAECNDGNPCTTDGCDPVAGCTHVPVAPPCP